MIDSSQEKQSLVEVEDGDRGGSGLLTIFFCITLLFILWFCSTCFLTISITKTIF